MGEGGISFEKQKFLSPQDIDENFSTYGFFVPIFNNSTKNYN